MQPARIVGGVAEILAAIGGELCLLAGGLIAYPQVPVADESLELAVGRGDAGLFAALRQLRFVVAMAGAGKVADVLLVVVGDVEPAVGIDAYGADGEFGRRDRLADGLAQRGGELLLIEQRD